MKFKWVLLSCIGFLLAFHLWSLLRYPPPFVDEVWNVSRAWSFLHTGRNFGQLDSGVFDRINGYWTFFPLFPTLLFSASLKLLEQPALWPLRLVTLAAGAGLLGAVYAIAYRLQGRILALVSLVICGLSLPFIGMAHLARADIIVAALGFTAIALYLYNDRCRFWVGWLSGFLLGLAFEFHANAAIYAPVLGILYLWDSRLNFWRRRDFWGFMLGGLLGGALYAMIHILPYPQEYQTFMKLAFSASHLPPLLTGSLKVIGDSVLDTLVLIVSFYATTLLLVIWSAIISKRQRLQAGSRWLVVTAALCLIFVMLVRVKSYYYVILISPALDISIAFLVLSLWRDMRSESFPDFIQRMVLWLLCAVMVATRLPQLASLLLLSAWAVAIVLWPRRNFSKPVTLVYGVGLAISLLLLRTVFWSYALVFMPALDLLLTAFSVKLLSLSRVLYGKPYMKVAIFCTCFISGVIFSVSLTLHNHEQDYRLTQARINQVIQPQDSIMGAQTYWLGLYEHTYYSWESLIYYQRYAPGTSAIDALSVFQPDILIIDGQLLNFISDKEYIFYDALKIPATPLYTYLADHATVIAKFDGGSSYGEIVVYRFQW